MSLSLAFYAGSGIGLLLGVIMGSSVTPTVAILLSALTSLLGAMLGLNDGHFSAAKAVRLGSFGFACVFGAYLGILVRSHNLLSPSLNELKALYLSLGFNEQQALNLIHIKAFGMPLVTQSMTADDAVSVSQAGPESDTAKVKQKISEIHPLKSRPSVNTVMPTQSMQAYQQHSSLLFSASVQAQACDELMTTDQTLPIDEVMNNFELTGGQWETLSLEVDRQIAGEFKKAVLLLIKQVVCEQSKDFNLVNERDALACLMLKQVKQQHHRDAWLVRLAHQDYWQTVVQLIKEQNLPANVHSHIIHYLDSLLCEPVQ